MQQYITTHFITNEYIVIIEPSNDVKDKINSLKKSFAEKYSCPQALHSKPHITLLKFTQLNVNEDKIITMLNKLALQNTAFQISLDGFGSFPTHTIYINVATQNNIVELVKSLKPIQAFLKLDKEHKPHFITTPHLTLARKLLPWQYEKSWLEYNNTHFTASFNANHLLLLKRNENQKYYSIVATFNLLGKKESMAEQTSLFM